MSMEQAKYNDFDRTVIGGGIGREMDNIKSGIRYPQQECSIGAIGIGVPTGKETAVDQIVQLREHVNTLHEMFTVLEQKLSPVRYLSPQCAEEKLNKSCNGSELRQALADQNERLMALRIRLNILMDEIDL